VEGDTAAADASGAREEWRAARKKLAQREAEQARRQPRSLGTAARRLRSPVGALTPFWRKIGTLDGQLTLPSETALLLRPRGRRERVLALPGREQEAAIRARSTPPSATRSPTLAPSVSTVGSAGCAQQATRRIVTTLYPGCELGLLRERKERRTWPNGRRRDSPPTSERR
jgi:hypothetical protein